MEPECVTIIPARKYLSFYLSNDSSIWMSKDKEIIARKPGWSYGDLLRAVKILPFFHGALHNFVKRHSAEYCMINASFFVCFSHYFFFSFTVFNNSKIFVLFGVKTLYWQKKAGIKFLALSSSNLITLITFNFLFCKSLVLCPPCFLPNFLFLFYVLLHFHPLPPQNAAF